MLPDDVTFEIFQFLEIKDLLNVALVCKDWKIVSENDLIWKQFVTNNQLKRIEKKDFKKISSNNVKTKFIYLRRVSNCWKNLKFERKSVQISHKYKITKIERSEQVKNLFLTGSTDLKLRIWSEKTLSPIFTHKDDFEIKKIFFDAKGLAIWTEGKLDLMKMSDNGYRIEPKYTSIDLKLGNNPEISPDYCSYISQKDILIMDREGKLNVKIENDDIIYQSKFGKKDQNLVLGFTKDNYLKIWDLRTPKTSVIKYKTSIKNASQGMYLNDNSLGLEINKKFHLINFKTLKEQVLQHDYQHVCLLSDKVIFGKKVVGLSKFEIYDISTKETINAWKSFDGSLDALNCNETSMLYSTDCLINLDEINF